MRHVKFLCVLLIGGCAASTSSTPAGTPAKPVTPSAPLATAPTTTALPATSERTLRDDLKTLLDAKSADGEVAQNVLDRIKPDLITFGHRANEILRDDYLPHPDAGITVRPYLPYVLELTSQLDPAGSRKLAMKFKDYLDGQLSDYDNAPDHGGFLDKLGAGPAGDLRHMLDLRNETDSLIERLTPAAATTAVP